MKHLPSRCQGQSFVLWYWVFLCPPDVVAAEGALPSEVPSNDTLGDLENEVPPPMEFCH